MKRPEITIFGRTLFGWRIRYSVVLVVLHFLALPAFAIRQLCRVVVFIRRHQRIRAGSIPCGTCGSRVDLDGFGECPVCHHRGFGSLLYCQNCRSSFETLRCPTCTATMTVV